jgi:magnesium chelatase family protein
VRACLLDPIAQEAVADVAGRLFLSARGVHRLLRVARSIADLDGQTAVGTATVLAAAALRDPAGRTEPALAA